MSADGTWDIKLTTHMGQQKGTMEFATDGDKLSGKLIGAMGTVEIDEGTVSGNDLTFVAKVEEPIVVTIEGRGTVDGDEISGQVEMGAFGSATFAGNRRV